MLSVMTNHARRPPRPTRPQQNGGPSATVRSAAGPGEALAGLIAGQPAELTPQQEAEMAIERQMTQIRQIHDNLAKMLREDPAAFVQKLPEMFGQAIAQMVAQGVAQAIQQLGAVRVKVADRVCAACLEQRIAWNTRHKDAIERAQALAMAQVGATGPQDPRLQQVDLIPLLPPELHPGAQPDGMPGMFDSITTIGGTEYCPNHHPSVPQQTGGKLILMPGVPVHAAARLAMAGMPGMPGASVG